MRIDIKRVVIVLLICFSVQNILEAQFVSDEHHWEIKGFVDTYHALRLEDPNDFMSSRSRVRFEVGREVKNATFFASINATYNALQPSRTGFVLREAYIDYRKDHWGFRIGRQIVIWGSADGLRITDLLSPMDMSEFLAQDYDDIRMPIHALRFFVFNRFMKIELVGVPTFHGFLLPTEKNNPWSLLPKDPPFPLVWNDKGSTPVCKLSNMEYGGRASFTFSGIDFSFSALHTWNKMPVITYEPSLSGIEVKPQYYRMGFFGGDLSVPIGPVVLRGEAAYNVSKHFSYKPEFMMMPQKGFNTLNWLVGLDWYAPRNWFLSAQFSSENIFKYKPYVQQAENTALVTFNISKSVINNTLQFSDFLYFDIQDKGWLNRTIIDYALNDQIHIFLGCDWLGGEKGIFETYKNNSEVWLKAKYSF